MRVLETQNRILPNLPNIPTVKDLCNVNGRIESEQSIITNLSYFGYIGGETYTYKPEEETDFCPSFEISIFNQATLRGYNWVNKFPFIEMENKNIRNTDVLIEYFGNSSGIMFYRFSYVYQNYNVYVWDSDLLATGKDGKSKVEEKQKIYNYIEFFIDLLSNANS